MSTSQEFAQKQNTKAKKMMLWFGMISIMMMFAGLTSAYIVSRSRPDWLTDFKMPSSFFISTAAILLSSVTLHFSKRAIQKGASKNGMSLLLVTLLLGLIFVAFQFTGFSQIVKSGYYFTGSQSTITTSFFYAIVLTHVAHVFSGLVVLLVIIYNHFKQKYTPTKTLGLQLGVTFWHFLDFLWLYLMLFFYFFT